MFSGDIYAAEAPYWVESNTTYFPHFLSSTKPADEPRCYRIRPPMSYDNTHSLQQNPQ